MATMEQGTSSNSLKGCKVKKSIDVRRPSSVLRLMPWERRHQHSMKDFFGSPRRKKSSVRDSPFRCSAPSGQNLHSDLKEININPKSWDVKEKGKCYLQREINKIQDLQQNGNDSVSKVISPRQTEASVTFTSGICDGSLIVHHVGNSDGWHIPGQESLSLARDISTSSVLTGKLIHHQGEALRNVDNRDNVSNIDHSASCVHALSNTQISLNYNCCCQSIINSTVDDKSPVSSTDKYFDSPLSKTYVCAAKYNLHQLFTCEFPQVKKPLKERLL